ncbi:mCG146879 [Mus musculus]|nr:mCG146879 [Mus musculus]
MAQQLKFSPRKQEDCRLAMQSLHQCWVGMAAGCKSSLRAQRWDFRASWVVRVSTWRTLYLTREFHVIEFSGRMIKEILNIHLGPLCSYANMCIHDPHVHTQVHTCKHMIAHHVHIHHTYKEKKKEKQRSCLIKQKVKISLCCI